MTDPDTKICAGCATPITDTSYLDRGVVARCEWADDDADFCVPCYMGVYSSVRHDQLIEESEKERIGNTYVYRHPSGWTDVEVADDPGTDRAVEILGDELAALGIAVITDAGANPISGADDDQNGDDDGDTQQAA